VSADAKKLSPVSLCSRSLRDEDLPCVGELTSLRQLRLGGCGLLTDDGDRHFHNGVNCLSRSVMR
jgi:hypothetical protein